ncbi:hypothetical protein CFIO01_07877 [Colletotrichum fioriniae PJ7]|uniref:NB-ARC domain-containing protein n=1 Tax=Colletotrichum fioriniae PJ7 TaxID=1445577 RepID=A0A010Q7N5_9PEZI|nr:hypothetical protein CFIO01_07877 [Colletotrichum fioriniae PJ7]
MEQSEMEAHFARQWASTSKSGTERMEPNDRRTIKIFRNYDDIKEDFFEGLDDTHQDLGMLEPRLIALPDEEATRRITQMLKKLGRACQTFQFHAGQSSTPSKGEKEACFEIFVSMTRFLSDAIRFLRDAGDISSLSSPHGHAQGSWVKLTDMYDSVQAEIDEWLKEIEKMAEIAQRQATMLSFLALSPRSFTDKAKLPCYVLPTASTNRFFNRDEVIEEIDHQLGEQRIDGLRSLALYGMGGVGKSHVALKYIEKKKAEKGLTAIFWVHAENIISFQQSFTDIALRLDLPGAQRTLHDENRLIVKDWLQQTECKWLIVYDNVESFDLLRANWPLPGSQGLALITTRNHSLAFDPASGGLEVPSWNTENGTKFLLHLLSGHISADLLANEAKSAYSLAERLSGHALAISNMSGLIQRRSWSISQLLDNYGSNLNFKDGLEAVWKVSFQNLKPDSAALLAAFSYCAPDSIPHSLFELQEAEDFPDSLLWFLDVDRGIAPDGKRVSQEARRQNGNDVQYVGAMSAVGTARIAAQELFQARKEARSRVLRLHEDLRNVGSMRTVGIHLFKIPFIPADFSSRFLLEQQTWPELEDLVEVGKLALATLPEQDPELYNLTSPDTYIGQMWARRGHYRLAIEVMVSARNMKLKAPQEDHQNLSWMANNISAFFSCLGEYETALEWQETSKVSWERWAKSENVEFHWHPNQRYGKGRTLAYMKRYDEARTDIDESLEDMMTTKPVIWGTAGPCQFARARLAMFEGDFKLAELLFQKAQSIWLTGNSSRTSDFYAATIYRMGCCALLEGEVERAAKYLQDAMAITSLRKDIQVGEHARCLYKLSEALYQIPGRELEADGLLKEAEELYWKRVEKPKGVSEEDHAEYEVPQIHPQEEDYDSLVYMLWR